MIIEMIFFVFDGKNRVHRYSNKEAATIIKNTADTLVIKWDLNGTEEFKKEHPAQIYFCERG